MKHRKTSFDDILTIQENNKNKGTKSDLVHHYTFFLDDIPIGRVMYMEPEPDVKCFSIGNFYLYPKYRGKGYGTKCLNLILDKIKSIDHTLPIYLGVVDNNMAAIKLYTKFDFKIIKTIRKGKSILHQMCLGKPIQTQNQTKGKKSWISEKQSKP